MSYILDALRRSESERQQGRAPDLANSVQMVHKPKRRAIPVGVWVALALFFNGAILAVIFWPGSGFLASTVDNHPAEPVEEPAPKPASAVKPSPAGVTAEPVEMLEPKPEPQVARVEPATNAGAQEPAQEEAEPLPEPMLITPSSTQSEEIYPEAQAGSVMSEKPTLIVPSRRDDAPATLPGATGQAPPKYDFADGPPVQHLVEKPMAFQRSIPDLHFSSHIYASDPAARRVMINDNYLRPGDSFSGIRVEAITGDGVVLSAYGETFRVGVVRDWVTPR
ncbi:general secretion pathway protein GspB [Marinobacter fonticola]|uniref:general secretion pathway protein GspB n=1 Tax=Marinobacter fonticola TaxID=2603215 RepID=UPI0011E68943|nr:general secretion pathway protein GspB [Marinobacter fonticola]